jgi:hypothetical protein
MKPMKTIVLSKHVQESIALGINRVAMETCFKYSSNN